MMEKESKGSLPLTKSQRCSLCTKSRLPWGAFVMKYLPPFVCYKKFSFKCTIIILTFLTYTSYHMTRRTFSTVKSVLAPHCTNGSGDSDSLMLLNKNTCNSSSDEGWSPFDGSNSKTLLGIVDCSFLFTYAISQFFSGLIGDRVNLRNFLTVGMIGSGITTGLMGVAHFADIHKLYYFILVQIFFGIFQSTGWPGVVAVMGNWFGKQGRGLLMGIWNSHTSIGNILGILIPSIWAERGKNWGWSFLVPGFIMIAMGITVYLFLIIDPTDIGLDPPRHHTEKLSIQGNSPKIHNENDRIQTTNVNHQDERTKLLSDKDSPVITGDAKIKRRISMVIYRRVYNVIVGSKEEGAAVGFLEALGIQGVVEYSFALFFAKFVAYTFLFWLPFYVKRTHIANKALNNEEASLIASLFDVGAIIGGITAGGISDIAGTRAITCTLMLYLSVPALYTYPHYGHYSKASSIVLLMVTGFFVNGPYALITTAVSSDLGTQEKLKNNKNAKAVVSAIIDGTGSIGAALGPLLAGLISNKSSWDTVFYLLMACSLLSSVFLTRLVIYDCLKIYRRIKQRFTGNEC